MTNEWKFLLVVALFLLPLVIMIGIYVFRDARRRGMKALAWALTAMAVPGLMGFIAYLLERGKYAARLCPDCGTPIPDGTPRCPDCGAVFRYTCPGCDGPVDEAWVFCPGCGENQMGERKPLAIPVKPRDNGFWVVLTALILVPLVLVLYANLYIFDDMGEYHFLSRHNPDGTIRTDFVEPEDITRERWYGYIWTNYETGETVSVQKEQKGYTVITAGDEVFWKRGTGGGVNHPGPGLSIPFDMISEMDPGGIRIAEGKYYQDEAGNLTKLVLSTGGGLGRNGTTSLTLTFTWEDGLLTKQRMTVPGGGWQEWRCTWENGARTAAEIWSDSGGLLETIRYTTSRDGTIRTAVHYDPAGNQTKTVLTAFDESGSICSEEVYEGSRLVSRMEYDYDQLGFLLRPYNLAILGLVWVGLLALCCTLLLADRPQKGRFVEKSILDSERRKNMEIKEKKGKRSYAPLLCLAAYLLNLLLILAFQALFVHNIPLPEQETADFEPDFSQAAFFENSEILDIGGTYDEYYILYREDGATRLVKLESNLYFRRYNILEHSVTDIPAESGEQTIERPNFLGKDIITITDGTEITGLRSEGLMRQQSIIQAFHAGGGIVLLLLEMAVWSLIKKLLGR